MFKQSLLSKLIIIFSLASISNVALAENRFYAGTNVSFLDYSQGQTVDTSLTTIYGRFGYQFNNNFSAEFRLGVGVSVDEISDAVDEISDAVDEISGAIDAINTIDLADAMSAMGVMDALDTINASIDDIDDVEASVYGFLGAYVRAGTPAGKYFYPYLTLGVTEGRIENVGDDLVSIGVDDSISLSGISYGVGTDIRFSKNWGANIEYMNYFDKNNIEIRGFSIGLVTKF